MNKVAEMSAGTPKAEAMASSVTESLSGLTAGGTQVAALQAEEYSSSPTDAAAVMKEVPAAEQQPLNVPADQVLTAVEPSADQALAAHQAEPLAEATAPAEDLAAAAAPADQPLSNEVPATASLQADGGLAATPTAGGA